MLKGFLLGAVTVAALGLSTAGSARQCPADWKQRALETQWASNIHKDFLDNHRDDYADFHRFWIESHTRAAEILLEFGRDCG